MHWLGGLEAAVKRADKITDEVRSAFAGLMEPVWIEEYLATRIEPLREELDLIKNTGTT